MLGGTYFYKCIDSSTSQETVFRYQYLEVAGENFGAKKHPIFVVLKANYIAFYFDFVSIKELFRIDLFYSDLHYDNSLAEQLIRYYNNEVDLEKIINKKSKISLNIKKNYFIDDSNKFIYDDVPNNTVDSVLIFKIIFLHFLFDLMHSYIFRNCINYNNTIKVLGENYFVKSIIAKCNYNYYAEFADDLVYIEAMRKWIDLATDEKNSNSLNSSSGWFKDAENEVNSIISPIDTTTKKEVVNQKLRGLFLTSKKDEAIKSDLEEIRDKVYNFFLDKYDLFSLEKVNWFYHKKVLCLYLIIMIIIFLLIQIFCLKINLWLMLLNLCIGYSAISFLRHPIFKVLNYFMLKFSINSPKMIAAIFALWLGFIPICDEMLKLSLNMSLNKFMFFCGITLLFIFVLLSFYIGIVDKISKPFHKALHLMFNGISSSLFIGLFAMYFVSDYIYKNPAEFLPNVKSTIELEDYEKIAQYVKINQCYDNKCCEISHRHLFQLDSYLKDSLVNKNIITSSIDSSNLKTIDFYYGIFESTLMDLRSNIIDEHHSEIGFWQVPVVSEIKMFKYKIFIFPKLLIIYSIITFYIGIFLQLTFSGKNYKDRF